MVARKTSASPTRIYTYGGAWCGKLASAIRPEFDKLGYAELRRAHSYYNARVEIERARRARYREIRGEHDAAIDALTLELSGLKSQIDAVHETIRAVRAKARKAVKTPELSEQFKALKARRKDAAERLRAARAEFAARVEPHDKESRRRVAELKEVTGKVGPRAVEKFNETTLREMLADPAVSDTWKAIARADADSLAAVKRLRAARGELGETYLYVEKALEAAFRSATDPEFAPWMNQGRIGVQLRNTTVRDLFNGRCPKVQIAPVPPDTWSRTKSYRQHQGKTACNIRVSRSEYASIPVNIHREPPWDAKVNSVWIYCTRVGTTWRYSLQLAVESESFRRVVPLDAQGRTVAINMGWRDMGDRMRVGMCVDDSGKTWELSIPAEIKSRLEYCSVLRGIRDRNFDEIVKRLGAWMKATPVPEWLREMTQHMHSWRNHGRLVAVIHHWANNRFQGDEAMWDEINRPWDPVARKAGWLADSRHLYDWEANQRDRTIGRRSALYKLIARSLADNYGTVVLGNVNYAQLAKLAEPGEENALHQAARFGRTVACLHSLVGAIDSAVGKEHTPRASADHITTDCHVCGHRHSERPVDVMHTCENCGTEADQDTRAAFNLLFRHSPEFESTWRKESRGSQAAE